MSEKTTQIAVVPSTPRGEITVECALSREAQASLGSLISLDTDAGRTAANKAGFAAAKGAMAVLANSAGLVYAEDAAKTATDPRMVRAAQYAVRSYRAKLGIGNAS